MSEITDYVSKGINAVFGQSPPDLTVANGYLSTYSAQTYLLINKLNGLCGCDFIAEAKLQGITPSQAVVNSIYVAFSAVGVIPSSDIILRQAVDSDFSEGTLTTLGSFYSCISADDSSPILVATGSNTESGYVLSMKQCNNWAMNELVLDEIGYFIDQDNNAQYFSLTGSAPCQKFIHTFYVFSFTPVGYGYGVCMQALYGDGDLL
jgi:hypothetical protein